MEDRLSAACTDVDDDAVVLEASIARRLRDEAKHPLRLIGVECVDVAERFDVPLGNHEQVRRRLRRDVAQGRETVGFRDVVALTVELAEEAVVRQR